MRLLAYGGTRYIERCRVGEWPEIAEGALSDTYGLPSGARSYGVGLLADGQPFLIVRERQNLENRGGYAFTLLLDPGREVWERADIDWNGAKLMLSLFGEHGAAGRRLLSDPESFTAQEIEELLRGLRPAPATQPCTRETEPVSALWAGSSLGPPLLVCAPGDVGFDERPPLECLDAALDALPLPFRCGFGWLVGGSEEHGRAFGARLTLDDGATPGAGEVRELVKKGRLILADWATVSELEESVLRNRSAVPVWRWETSRYKTPREFFKDLGVLARGYRVKSEEDAEVFVRDAEDPELEKSPLLGHIRQRASQVALSGTGTLTPLRTLNALKRHLDEGKELKPSDVERLDPETLSAEMARRNLSPSFAVCRLRLAWETRLRVWHRLITEVEKADSIPARLEEAIGDLEDDPAGKDPSARIEELVGAAVDRTLAQCDSLLVWLDARDNAVLRRWVEMYLSAEADRRARAMKGGAWPLEYMAFVRDAGGGHLANSGLRGKGAETLVKTLLEESRRSGKLSAEAQDWLGQLVVSPFRQCVPLQAKLDVAKALGEGWLWFYRLWQLYHGQKAEADGAASEAERLRLRRELHELIAPDEAINPKPFLNAAPNLKGLLDLLGDIPAADLESLAARKPSLGPTAARGWLEGWRVLDPAGVYQSELLRYAQSVPSLRIADFPLADLEEVKLYELIELLLAVGRRDDDEKSRVRLTDIFSKHPDDERLGGALNSAVGRAAQDDAKAETFVRRYAGQTPATGVLFPHLGPAEQRSWVQLMAARDEGFPDEVNNLYATAVKTRKDKLEPYTEAVLQFLRTDEGRELKRRVGTWYHSILSAGDINENLDNLLGAEEAAQEAPAPRAGESAPWWKKLASYFKTGEEETDAEQTREAPPGAEEKAAGEAAAAEHSHSHTPGNTLGTSRPGGRSLSKLGEKLPDLSRPTAGGKNKKDDPQ